MGVSVTWLCAALVLVAAAGADRGGSSLRGALEALQRRQRSRTHPPLAPQPDYDALYEFVPPQGYPEPDYSVDIEDVEDEPNPRYVVKLLGDNERSPEAYEYKLIKKKNNHFEMAGPNKHQSAFRERAHHSNNDKLRDLFMDKNELEDDKKLDVNEKDAEYALLLGQLWSKYKYNKEQANNMESAPQGVVKLYKDKIVKKRYSDNWGPIAFKRKRSSDPVGPILPDYSENKIEAETSDPNYGTYELNDNDKDDLREEYSIAFQPLDDDALSDLADDDQYTYDNVEKRFAVSKRSSGPYDFGAKKLTQNQNKREAMKTFRSSSGTDPKILKDLSKIFGNSEINFIKNHVKRSSDHEESIHDVAPPMVTVNYNHTQEHNHSIVPDDNSHETHGHNMHHPGISGKEAEVEHEHNHDHVHEHEHTSHEKEAEKPIILKKKSIDWSDYFGINKRFKKPVTFIKENLGTQDKLRKQYFDTFNKEVIYPLNAFQRHTYVKRNFIKPRPSEKTEIQVDNFDKDHTATIHNDQKRNTADESDSKLDSIDKKLKSMEGLIVDEALHFSNTGDELDSKEEQEMKEKLLSRLAAAYSLEKMRKALKEFKNSLQTQQPDYSDMSPSPTDEAKKKRVAVKKELLNNEIPLSNKLHEKNNDFEDEQGAGHYLNGQVDEQFSEGYMGGSGRHRVPVISTVSAEDDSCPVLAKIVQRCRSVDLLAGDRGQLFLPLCSLHQICYLCGEAPPTTCDLVFLSEADTTCEGDMSCQRAARSTLMALRELHDNLDDELDGECEASPCLPATLKLNIGWQRALQR